MSDAGRCIGCKYWQGDLDKAAAAIEEYGLIVVSQEHCSINSATCSKVRYEGVSVFIDGDYRSYMIEFEPWFGCRFWEQR